LMGSATMVGSAAMTSASPRTTVFHPPFVRRAPRGTATTPTRPLPPTLEKSSVSRRDHSWRPPLERPTSPCRAFSYLPQAQTHAPRASSVLDTTERPWSPAREASHCETPRLFSPSNSERSSPSQAERRPHHMSRAPCPSHVSSGQASPSRPCSDLTSVSSTPPSRAICRAVPADRSPARQTHVGPLGDAGESREQGASIETLAGLAEGLCTTIEAIEASAQAMAYASVLEAEEAAQTRCGAAFSESRGRPASERPPRIATAATRSEYRDGTLEPTLSRSHRGGELQVERTTTSDWDDAEALAKSLAESTSLAADRMKARTQGPSASTVPGTDLGRFSPRTQAAHERRTRSPRQESVTTKTHDPRRAGRDVTSSTEPPQSEPTDGEASPHVSFGPEVKVMAKRDDPRRTERDVTWSTEPPLSEPTDGEASPRVSFGPEVKVTTSPAKPAARKCDEVLRFRRHAAQRATQLLDQIDRLQREESHHMRMPVESSVDAPRGASASS